MYQYYRKDLTIQLTQTQRNLDTSASRKEHSAMLNSIGNIRQRVKEKINQEYILAVLSAADADTAVHVIVQR